MRCRAARRLLSDRLDAPLHPRDAAQLEDHLAHCAECRALERSLGASLEALRSLPSERPNARLRPGEERYVLEHIVRESEQASPWWRQLSGFAAGAVALVVVALLVSGLLRSLGGFEPGDPPASGPAPASQSGPALTPTSQPMTLSAPAAATAPAEPPGTTPLIVEHEPESMDEALAVDRVMAYFTSINANDYAAAYAVLGEAMQEAQSLDDFIAGFARTDHDELTILSSQPTEIPGRWAVEVSLAAHQTDGSIKWYRGTYEVAHEGGVAKIVGARVLEVPGPFGTPTPLAPPCSLDQLVASVDAVPSGDTLGIAVELANDGTGCALATTISVTIESAGGKRLPVAGNGTPSPFRVPYLSPGGTRAEFEWANWCADDRPVTITVAIADQRLRVERAGLPACVEPRAASVLRPVSATTVSGTVLHVSAVEGTLELTLAEGTVTAVELSRVVVYDARGEVLSVTDIAAGDRVIVTGHPSPDGGALQAVHVVVMDEP